MELSALFAATVLVAAAPALVRYAAPTLAYGTLVTAVALQCVLGTFVFPSVERHRPRHLPYLATQTALALAIIYLARSYGPVPIILIPLAAQAGLLLEWRGAMVFAVTLTLLKSALNLALGADLDWLLVWTLTAGTGVFFGVLFAQVIRDVRRSQAEVERLNRDLSAANERLQDTARHTASLAAAEERNRLAREIHDSVGHALTTLRVQLDAAGQVLSQDPDRARDLIDKAHTVAGQGLDEVRRAVAAMRAEPVPRELATALTELVERARQTGLHVQLDVDGAPRPLAPEIYTTLYRTAQEGLTNVRKHGANGTARLSLTLTPERARLALRNAAEANGAAPPSGFGLLGLRERAEFVGGSLQARRDGDEFVLDLEVPLQ
ncbi:MAG: sensor histidine kinase [Planctomycetota bacterium]